MELDSAGGNWPEVKQNALRYLAVNPLVPAPYRYLADAAHHMGAVKEGMAACQALVQLDPPDPAETHYRLASFLYEAGEPTAKRHVLQALEEAPRYHDALRLLLQIETNSSTPLLPRQTNAVPALRVEPPPK